MAGKSVISDRIGRGQMIESWPWSRSKPGKADNTLLRWWAVSRSMRWLPRGTAGCHGRCARCHVGHEVVALWVAPHWSNCCGHGPLVYLPAWRSGWVVRRKQDSFSSWEFTQDANHVSLLSFQGTINSIWPLRDPPRSIGSLTLTSSVGFCSWWDL